MSLLIDFNATLHIFFIVGLNTIVLIIVYVIKHEYLLFNKLLKNIINTKYISRINKRLTERRNRILISNNVSYIDYITGRHVIANIFVTYILLI